MTLFTLSGEIFARSVACADLLRLFSFSFPSSSSAFFDRWPNFAREALPRILAALPHVDLIVEVRDARLPLLTQLPLQPPEGGQKPRLIVLTHADQVCLSQ